MRSLQVFPLILLFTLCAALSLLSNTLPTTMLSPVAVGDSNVVKEVPASFYTAHPVNPSKADQAKAYPWLSADGLRLYYTLCDEQSIYVATRESFSAWFGEGQPLELEQGHHISCWFTDDELTAYFVVRGGESGAGLTTELNRAVRKSRDAEFSYPEIITLHGYGLRGFLSGASFTQDEQFLYLYHARVGSPKVILEFQRFSENAYCLNAELPLPFGMSAGPGQISRDNLRYYTSMEPAEGGEPLLGYYERESLLDPFEHFVFVEEDGYGTIMGRQPTVSANESVLVFASTQENYWADNRLQIARRSVLSSVVESKVDKGAFLSLRVNPGSGLLHIHFNLAVANDERTILLYNGNGEEAGRYRIPAGNAQANLDVSGLPSGAYFCQALVGTRPIGVEKFLVVK